MGHQVAQNSMRTGLLPVTAARSTGLPSRSGKNHRRSGRANRDPDVELGQGGSGDVRRDHNRPGRSDPQNPESHHTRPALTR